MPQVCQTCQHPHRSRLEASILNGKPLNHVARDFALSPASVRRHWKHHVKRDILAATQEANLTAGNTLLDRIKASHHDLKRILERAERTSELSVAVNAIQAGLRALELEGRLTGEISSGGVVVNVALGMRIDVAQRRLAVMDEARALTPRQVAERAAECLRAWNAMHGADAGEVIEVLAPARAAHQLAPAPS